MKQTTTGTALKPQEYEGSLVYEVPLGGELAKSLGVRCLVDWEDAELVSRYSWFANRQGSSGFYARTNTRLSNGKRSSMLMHRFLLGAKKGEFIDHKNLQRFDNRRRNLRFASREENARNRPAEKGAESPYKGVTREKRLGHSLWLASITSGLESEHLGIFNTEIEAALAYDRRARELHGAFARLNFPMDCEAGQDAVLDRSGVPNYDEVKDIRPNRIVYPFRLLEDEQISWILRTYCPGEKKGDCGLRPIMDRFGVCTRKAWDWANRLRETHPHLVDVPA